MENSQSSGRLLAFINKRVENREDAEDILQGVFCKTIESVSVMQSIKNVVGWLYTSARNKIIDWYRKKRPYSISVQDEDSQAGLDTVLAELKFNPEHAFYRNLLIEEITGESINTLLSRKRYAVQFVRNRLKEINDIINQMT